MLHKAKTNKPDDSKQQKDESLCLKKKKKKEHLVFLSSTNPKFPPESCTNFGAGKGFSFEKR